MGFAASLARLALLPSFFGPFLFFWRAFFVRGPFFPFLGGGGGGWWPCFSFFHFFGGGAFFCPFIIMKGGGGGGRRGPFFWALCFGPFPTAKKRSQNTPPLPKKIGLPGALFWGALLWPFVWGALGPFLACFGCFFGGFFLCPFSLHNKN